MRAVKWLILSFCSSLFLGISGTAWSSDHMVILPSDMPVPASATPESIRELKLLLKIVAKGQCDTSRCTYGVELETAVVSARDTSENIPAVLTLVLNEKKEKAEESYIGMILEFTNPKSQENFRVTVLDIGMDGIVDVMAQQIVQPVPNMGTETLLNKACFARFQVEVCSKPIVGPPKGFDTNMYANYVVIVASKLSVAFKNSGGKRT